MAQYALSGFPSLVLLYLSALLSVFTKRRWSPKVESARFPQIEISVIAPTTIRPSTLQRFKALAGWPAARKSTQTKPTEETKGASAEATTTAAPEITPDMEPHVPLVFLMSQTFRLAMAVMFSWDFPYQVMGFAVNRRVRYSLHRFITAGDMLVHKCTLNQDARTTPGGHLEFDVFFTSKLASSGELVWTSTLTLVLMGPAGKKHKGPKREAAPLTATDQAGSPAGDEPAMVPLGKPVLLKEDAGRQYAWLDGDISPMHLWGWTARLVGFPKPVANVHLLMGKLEAALVQAMGETGGQLPIPATLEAEFKSPTLLPCKIQISVAVSGTSPIEVAHHAGKAPQHPALGAPRAAAAGGVKGELEGKGLVRHAQSAEGLPFVLTRMSATGEDKGPGKVVAVGKLLLRSELQPASS